MTTYIHYGSSQFHEFLPVHNKPMMTKPVGGLWASPVDAKFGWREWCEREGFFLESLETHFEFTLTDNAKILHLDCVTQLENLPKCTQGIPQELHIQDIYTLLDFEKLQEVYDGIELHLSDERHPESDPWRWTKGLYFQLYGWDCDSILIFNYKIVHPIE